MLADIQAEDSETGRLVPSPVRAMEADADVRGSWFTAALVFNGIGLILLLSVVVIMTIGKIL
jgi:hypothetical protein